MRTEKPCISCGETKALDEFYKHPAMLDGHLNKCKLCVKAYTRAHYRIPEVRMRVKAYDAKRESLPSRKLRKLEYKRAYKLKNRVKLIARNLVASALKKGRLYKKPCEVCGSQKVEAHHTDYSKPLDVTWLCFTHHRQAHEQLI